MEEVSGSADDGSDSPGAINSGGGVGAKSVLDVPFDGRVPLTQHSLMSVQNIFAMTGMFLFPAILGATLHLPTEKIAELYGATFVVSGLGTLLQAMLGLKLPIVLGPWAAVLAGLIISGEINGLKAAFGSLFVATLIWAVLSLPIRGISFIGFVGRIFREPMLYGGVNLMLMIALTSTTVVNWIGTPVQPGFGAANWIGGGVAILVTFAILLVGKGFLRSAAMFSGIIVGALAYSIFTPINFTRVSQASWIVAPKLFPFGFSVNWVLVLLFFILILSSIAWTLSLYNVAAEWSDETLSGQRMAWGIFGQSIAAIVASILGTFTLVAYPDNLGIVRTSKVGSRYITATTGVLLIIGGFILKFDEIFVSIPSNVIAAAAVVLFGVIAMSGIDTLTRVKWDQLNYLVLGVPIMLALGGLFVAPTTIAHYPLLAREIIINPFLTGPVLLIVLHLIVNKVVRPLMQGSASAIR